ncbi:hypothetical protein BDZ97DRAFT_754056 [Flammula alnicola]|nr:hypothetical protein BDZ97DRAFT_754056 [Flammula alnicola]
MITGKCFTSVVGMSTDPRRVIQKAFKDFHAPEASHDSSDVVDPPRCHPNTRAAILQKLARWARRPTTKSRILWIGPAGA